jgi:transcriptional regulator with XRE-family HTH domain
MQIMISPAQSRAARAMLNLGLREVADQARVSINTLSRFEKDDRGATSTDTVLKVVQLYRSKGIEFLDGNTVRYPTGAAQHSQQAA